MASIKKPQRSPAEIEDIILRKIFLVSLNESTDPKVVYLEQTAAEILSEDKPLLLSKDLTERILIDRLSGDFPAAEPPFPYLVSCYRRCLDELKKISAMRDAAVRSQIESAVNQAKKLVASYSRIHVGNPDMFLVGSASARAPPSSDLLGLVFSEVASPMDGESSLAGGMSPPPGFVDEFFREGDYESLELVMRDLFEKLKASVERVSVLGNFQQPLRALVMLVGYPNCAKALVNHPRWIPMESFGMVKDGRALEMMSILGAFLHVSALPDAPEFRSRPDVGSVKCLIAKLETFIYRMTFGCFRFMHIA